MCAIKLAAVGVGFIVGAGAALAGVTALMAREAQESFEYNKKHIG